MLGYYRVKYPQKYATAGLLQQSMLTEPCFNLNTLTMANESLLYQNLHTEKLVVLSAWVVITVSPSVLSVFRFVCQGVAQISFHQMTSVCRGQEQ